MLKKISCCALLSSLSICVAGEKYPALGQDTFTTLIGTDGKVIRTIVKTNDPEWHRNVVLYRDALHQYNSHDSKQDQSKSPLEAKLKTAKKLDTTGSALASSNLGGFYMSNRQYTKAEECFRDALKARMQKLPQCSPDVAVSYHNLGAALEFQKKFDNAADMYEHSEKTWEGLGAKYKANLASELENIGEFDYQTRNRFPQAEEVLKRALLIREGLKGKNDPCLVPALSSLGSVLESENKIGEAHIYEQRFHKLVKSMKSASFNGTAYAYAEYSPPKKTRK